MGSSNSKNEQDGPIRKPKRLKTTFRKSNFRR